MRRGFFPVLFGGGLTIFFWIFIIIIAIFVLGPMLAITLSKELMLLFQIAASIIILSYVRNILGPGTLSLVVAGVLIYIFVFILPQLTIGIWAVYTVLGLGIWTILFWGLPVLFRGWGR